MSDRVCNVLFLCTGNSARSVLAESCLNSLGKGRFKGYSAGSFPTGKVNPFAIELLRKQNMPTGDLRSKAWDEFAQPGAPQMDVIITVCDQAAGETCPVWPGQPVSVHWGVADPAAATGADEEKRAAFLKAYATLRKRVECLVELPIDELDRTAFEQRLQQIGQEQ